MSCHRLQSNSFNSIKFLIHCFPYYCTLSHPIQIYPILPYPILSHPIISYSIPSYSTLSHLILSYPIQCYTMLWNTILSCPILSNATLYCTTHTGYHMWRLIPTTLWERWHQRTPHEERGHSVWSQWSHNYRTQADVLLPLTHVGAVLQCCAAALPEVPATVGIPCLQTQPTGDRRGSQRGESDKVRKRLTKNKNEV